MYSFDIFDTVIWRTVPKPVTIFKIMEEDISLKEMLKDKTKKFSKVRRNCEFILRRIYGGSISIYDIYQFIGKIYHLDENEMKKLIELELNTECQSWILNPDVIKEIESLIESGKKVILISDMYWNSKELREKLAEQNDVFANITMYISCEWKATKSNGKLYEIVKEKENVEYKEWYHVGDNVESDYKIPMKLGIKSKCIKPGVRYSFEKKINEKDEDTLIVYNTIVSTRTKSNGEAFDLGASFAAPMVYQYVSWCIDTAQKNDIQKLYFVLRDGYILKRVADVIIEKRGLKIKTEDLFGSRVAWRRPRITVEKLKNLSVWEKSNWIFRDPCYAYIAFERLGFNREEISKYIGEDYALSEIKSFGEFKFIMEKALDNSEFCNAVEIKAKQSGVALVKYFRQMIGKEESFAFVDTNSTGKSQKDLELLMREEAPELPQLRFFYHTYLGNEEDINNEKQFVFQVAKTQDRRFPEALFRAPYNPCYGYDINIDENVVPVYFKSEYCAWYAKFDYDSYLKGIIEFTKKIEEKRNKKEIHIDAYVNYLLEVANFNVMSKDIMQQVGKLPFSPDKEGNEVIDFYPNLTIKTLLHPFTELIYYPKGSFYCKGGLWILLYRFLFTAVRLLRYVKKRN